MDTRVLLKMLIEREVPLIVTVDDDMRPTVYMDNMPPNLLCYVHKATLLLSGLTGNGIDTSPNETVSLRDTNNIVAVMYTCDKSCTDIHVYKKPTPEGERVGEILRTAIDQTAKELETVDKLNQLHDFFNDIADIIKN